MVTARLISGSSFQRVGTNANIPALQLAAGDDLLITPSYIGLGDTEREVVIRFAEPLPDDSYLIDILGRGPFTLRNATGLPFNNGNNQSVRFDLDLGPNIQAVVPQPVVRTSNGTLTQLRNQIYVYFNSDRLDAAQAVKKDYYQLVYTADSLTSSDDFIVPLSAVNYDASLNRVNLVYERNLDSIVNPSTNLPVPITALRLRIGNDQSPLGATVSTLDLSATDAGSRFDSAYDLGSNWIGGTSSSILVNSTIKNLKAYKLDFPGANNELGNRDNQYQHHVTRVDSDGIQIVSYNFAIQLGNANRSVQLNAITEIQKTMVREALSLYEKYLGVRFQESDNLGFTIAVGDMQAINPLTSLTPIEPNGPGGLTYAAGPLLSNSSQSAVIIDIQDFNTAEDNQFGSELFRSFMRGIGVLLGLGNADELPQLTVQSNVPATDPSIERVFPGNADIVHGQYVLRPEGTDIDLYRFTIPAQGGKLGLQVAAERQSNSSLLDAALKLYQNQGTAANPNWVEISSNDDYFSNDPRIALDFVPGGDYIVGVSAKGNTTYNPNIEDSGLGGKSEGKYQLRVDFKPPAASTLVDSNGAPTALDGNGDGRPGGVFNYWFVPTRPDRAVPVVGTPDVSAYTVWVDKSAPANGNGTLASPYNTINRALQDANNAVTADTTKKRDVVVRILGNTQNKAYEIGFNRFGNPLADGSTFDVPKNVTVMIDAGAIIKVGRARISVGSSTVSVDRSGGSLQILGIPDSNVIVTSINDPTGIGLNPDRTPPAPGPGDWGGIDFRNRIDGADQTRTDKERSGLFLNSVIHSDIRYGGGQVIVDGVTQVIAPVNLVDSRPMIANNLVTRSADAAISATPNSFKEDDFEDPSSQANGLFVPDYDRIGPDIHGNTVINNSLNGLFVRTRTSAGESLETLTVTARFNDIDIPYVIGENLVIAGTPGGAIVDSTSPPTTVVELASSDGGTLTPGSYNYRVVYVDAAGNESLASLPTNTITLEAVGTTAAPGTITLTSLPPVNAGSVYVGRRLYRSDSTGGGVYRLIAQLNAVSTTYVDTGVTIGTPLIPLSAKLRSRLDASLMIDPGAILKFRGASIEVQDGGHLIAEGTVGLPIIMTSLNDARYGIGGTFDTANTKGTKSPSSGDWGGLFVGPGSSASLDYARVSYAGGSTRIEGAIASFNPIEIHQGDVRLTNSVLEKNGSGAESSNQSTRNGRGTNSAGTVFVRGAQPIIVNNRFVNNGSAAISVDVNSLGQDLVNDPGRSSGLISRIGDYPDNQGPLVRGNRLTNNSINGMVVRGQTLTTQSVWDDTDIVHVVQTTITSDNINTYGGLRLKSSPTESLVVKFGGGSALAGLTATGTPLDYSNRVGGSIQILGQPGYPVILTALADDTAGAGFGVDGRIQFDTNNNGDGSTSINNVVVLPTIPNTDQGTLIDDNVAPTNPGYFAFQPGAGGDELQSGITAQGTTQLFSNTDVIFDYLNYVDVGANGGAIRLSSTTITRQPTLIAPDLVVSEGSFVGNNNATVRWRVESRFDSGVSQLFNTVIFDSDQPLGDIRYVNYLDEDIQAPSDDFLYVTGTPGEADFRAYTIDSRERFGFSQGGFYQQGTNLQNATYEGWAADSFRNLANAIEGPGTNFTASGNINTTNLPPISDAVLGQVNGLADVTTAFAWRTDPNSTSTRITSFLELIPQAVQRASSPGAWSGVSLQTYSNDRNVAAISELESARASAPAGNDLPSTSQYLGQLAKSSNGGDESTRLGFEIQGTLNKPTDVDVYSFTANGGTEVWLDIDRTTTSLDSVVELVSADGDILALSDDSYLEETQASTHPLFSALAGNSVNPLRKSTLGQFPVSSQGEARDDYGVNPKDAGMRVVLPGLASQATLYHVRVRSSNQYPGQAVGTPALSNPASVGHGRSYGSYQLQVRLTEAQELPGSAVAYGDIRFATTGITLSGVPRHSPLVGENAEIDTPNNTFATAQDLGNILQTDRKTISVAGNLTSGSDVDWYSFNISYQSLISPLAKYLSTIFDVDYADGIGRPDLSMYLFNSNGNLIQFGENSNILDDRSSSIAGAGNSDLGRGTSGSLDPFIGSVELQAGRYFLAVSGSSQIPTVLANRLNRATGPGTTNDSGVRIQPINSGRYIVEDHVGDANSAVAKGPITPSFLPNSSRVEYSLGDVPLYLNRAPIAGSTDLYIANSFTGQVSNFARPNTTSATTSNNEDIRDIAIRSNGDLRAYRALANVGNANPDLHVQYLLIDPGTGVATATGFPGLFTQLADTTGVIFGVGYNVEALTYMGIGDSNELGFFVANLGAGNGGDYRNNILYRFDPNTGRALSAPASDFGFNINNPSGNFVGALTNITERGYIETNPAPGTISTSFAVTEATAVRAATTQRLINDGDTITLRAFPNTTVVIELNAGPELRLNLDPINAPTRVLNNGDQFTIDGVVYQIETGSNPVSTPGVRTVFYNTTMNNDQFVDALRQAVPSTIQVGYDGNRVNFSGATVGSFNTLVSRNVAFDLGTNGNVGSGRIAVNFLAEDTADTIATRISQTINTSGFAGLTAAAQGNIVQLVGAEAQSATGTAKLIGVAPGGLITGVAGIAGTLYAVSDTGGLFTVPSSALLSNFPGNIATYVNSSYALRGIHFTSLTAGPRNVDGGKYADLLFGTDINGTIYAFDTTGALKNVFVNGNSSVAAGVGGINGLAFSNLDYNLWHQTTQRGSNAPLDQGHGLLASPDGSQGNAVGGTSWYFGFQNAQTQDNATYGASTNPLTNARAGGAPLANTYNFPGGASGVLESRPFSLAGMVAADLPSLYFNYFLSTEDASTATLGGMRDAFRVYGAGDSGQWQLLTTNNDSESAPERTIDNTPNTTQTTTSAAVAWRQARVDLSNLAGSQNVRLRFEFSTSGGSGYGFGGGKGFEIRVPSGDKLRDGQTFNVSGTQFEIEMGPMLTFPSGAAIRNGDGFTLRGNSYVFWDGTGVAPTGIVIPFTSTDSPKVVANSALTAINASTFTKPTSTVNLTDPAGGSDTLNRSIAIGVTGTPIKVTGIGAIGDNPTLVANFDRDIDLTTVNLEAGTTIDIIASATAVNSPLDPYLRLFDASGRQLAANNDSGGSRDSKISFTVQDAGRYYIGVSASTNTRYNPAVAGTGSNGGSTGQYQLSIDVTPRFNASVVENRLQLDNGDGVALLQNSAISLSGSRGVPTFGNVPVYIRQTMTESQVAVEVKRALETALTGGRDKYTTFAQHGPYIDMTGVTVTNPGPFQLFGQRAEDFNSEWATNPFDRPANRAVNNGFEGLYLDDFFIGLAERGETVTGARADTSFVARSSPNSAIQVGPYQFEIRGGTDFGTPQRGSGIILNRSFEPNQQQSATQTIKFNSAANITDGQTLVVSDGIHSLTFEFEDANLLPNSPGKGVRSGNIQILYNPSLNESGAVIASRVRDLINSPNVQNVLQVSAISSDGSLVGQNSDTIALVGTASVTLPPALGVAVSSNDIGDRNTTREQGQIIIQNTRIANSAGFGITLQADARDSVSNAPNPGAVRNTVTLNNQRLIPGAVVSNNELIENVAGGINIVGDSNALVNGNPVATAPIPFARIVNNTILGGNVSAVPATPAITVGGDFYATGNLSFADQVKSYSPGAGGGPVPVAGLQVASNALGAPNYTGIGEPKPGQGVVSLGRGGTLVVQFTNNILTGSNDPRPDLAIYEVGTPELVRVEVSSDGINYTSVGSVSFANRFVDLDAFGFNSLSQLYFVRLTDEPGEGAQSGESVGGDIDAVGAISSRPGVNYAAGGVGIQVGANASPTLLNNIVANSRTGISVDSTSTSTVIGGTLYQLNSSNVAGTSTGSFPIIVAPSIPTFTDPVAGNLYPVSGSASIDSSVSSLVDRAALLAVKQPLGLAPSPILAPVTDINGMLRIDDPAVATPPGLGEQVFIDRGASDRADFNGPVAVSLSPIDNDAAGLDRNPAPGIVEVVSSSLSYFDVQIRDTSAIGGNSGGSGIARNSVSPNAILLYKNGQVLVEGVDYRFGYNSTSNIIRLTPLSGIWEGDAVYQIRFINKNEYSIQVPDPKSIVDGTAYTILDSTGKASVFELDTGLRVKIPQTLDGFTSTIVDGTIFRIDDGARRVTFEFDNNLKIADGNVQIPFDSQDTPEIVAQKMVAVVRSSGLNLSIKSLGLGEIQILGSNVLSLIPETSKLIVSGKSGVTPLYGLQIPTENGLPSTTIKDGQTFTIQRGANTVVFELDDNGAVAVDNVRVPLNTASIDGLAQGIVSALNSSTLGLTATVGSGGFVFVGTDSDILVQATNTVLKVVGIAGRPVSIPIQVDLTTIITSSQAASLVTDTINVQRLTGVNLTLLGSRIFIEGSQGVAGLGTESVSGIRDQAGNPMRATELDGQTLLTIFLGSGFDYGDAPSPYASKKADDGPRHKVVDGFSLGPTISADADAKTPYLDDNDGVTINPLYAAFTTSITVNVTGITLARPGFVNAWIDYNGNGIFESSEKIQILGRIANGDNVIPINVPSNAVIGKPVDLRVRLSSVSNLGPTGEAPDGEVEDYSITIQGNPYTNPTNNLDVNADGSVSPIDVLVLVNYINTNSISAHLPFPNGGVAGPPYLDVNGDGFVSPIDVLAVINFINRNSNGGGSTGGEGEASDMWISASSLAAPAVVINASTSNLGTGTTSNTASSKFQSLDQFLAQLSADIGPALAIEDLDWSNLAPNQDKDKSHSLDAALSQAVDELMPDWLS